MIIYEKEYQNSRNVCGEPFPEIVEFFENYDDECATVLILVADKDEMPCSLPAKDIRF